jgi:parallel beta-helix repeat protein
MPFFMKENCFMRKIISAIGIPLLLIGMLAIIPALRPVNACLEAIYIRADGSVDPPNTNLSTLDCVTYSFSGDVDMPIIVQRDHIIINGAGFTLQGNGSGNGIALSERVNVTIENLNINGFEFGIYLASSSGNFIVQNNITANTCAGIRLSQACWNGIYKNNIVGNHQYGIKLIASMGNHIFHNSFLDNAQQAGSSCPSMNIWDTGYPLGGKYWNNHDSADEFRGAYQNISGIDGICDLKYFINEEEVDNYPLMGPFSPHIMAGLNVPVFPDSDVSLVFNNVTDPGSTTLTRTTVAPPLPQGFMLVGSYYDIKVTASFSGGVIIRILYDDSGMTQEEEMTLRLMQTDIILGDVNVDGKVNLKDLCVILVALGSYPGHRRWNPSCDLNSDGKVNIRDLCIAIGHFGEKSQWEDITSFVDIQSNVIFGEASHFSIQGVTRGSAAS